MATSKSIFSAVLFFANYLFHTFSKLPYKSYSILKYLNMLRLCSIYHMHTNILLIYQMGKVGSSTIYNSLKTLSDEFQIYKIHDLDPFTLASDEILYKKKINSNIPLRLWESQFLSKKLKKTDHKKIKIVSLVRDPISRNISSFFQTLDLEYNLSFKTLLESNHENSAIELVDIFLNQVDWHDYPLNWFDKELNTFFGIDVFQHQFPKNLGYKIYKKDHTEVLIVKLEKIKTCGKEAFKNFLNIDNFKVLNDNISGKKVYSPLYNTFKDLIPLPESYIDRMYSSKYATHFYTQAEILDFSKEWTKVSET